MAKGLLISEVPLDQIWEVDTVYWFEDASGPTTVRSIIDHVRLIQEVDSAYPIILGEDGRVMDGMHRVAKALMEGRGTIDAVQFELNPERDYRNCRPSELPYD